ncbi:MAG: isoprenyl transferase [Candidatus Omnitrophica bacterium]|nr:isoprenyl transferase [Candidatus Omnitrophota bacterium]
MRNDASLGSIPRHVAVIMDGNGRWAKQRGLPRTQGHMEGLKRAEEIAQYAGEIGVEVLTLFTFSTENWSRPREEISVLMNLLAGVLSQKGQKFKKGNIRFQTIGRTDRIPEPILKAIETTKQETASCTGLILNLAFNYGGRLEILDAVKKIATQAQSGKITAEQIDEALISRALYTEGLPDPDLLIRTSGEKRISNFLLWQLAYAEFYFSDKFWPDFSPADFDCAIQDFQTRERRYGSVAG